ALTPLGVNTRVYPSPDLSHFVVASSYLDRPDAYSVIDAKGSPIAVLSDATLLPGEPFIERVAKATRHPDELVWASIHKPTDFDPLSKYPVILHVHGTVGFLWTSHGRDDRSNFRQSLADLGFIVVAVDGYGSVGRETAFLAEAVTAGHQCGGNRDGVELLKQLFEERPYMDQGRVGVYGYSQGGNCASRAILEYPDDFHVAVSGAGNHDSRFSHPDEITAYIGGGPNVFPDRFKAQDNSVLANQLKGKILFIVGAIDDDVPMITTFHLINALIGNNKSFDLTVFPNGTHAIHRSDYYRKVVWDYFAEHLLGEDLRLFDNSTRFGRTPQKVMIEPEVH
ncbi:MAG: prolyl oligopeptidase family serine peptidase, partial [Pseudomonadota bacterium]